MPAPRTVSRIALLALAGASLAGCQDYSSPKLTIRDVTLAEQSPDTTVLTFHIRGENPNDIDLKLLDVIYTFEPTNGSKFEALRSAEATLPRNGEREFHVPVVLKHDGATASASEINYRLSGTVEYLLPGSIAELLFDTGLRRPTATFSENGKLDLSKITATPTASVEPAAPQ